MAAKYDEFRLWGLAGGIIATVLALYSLLDATARFYFGPAGQIGLLELPYWIARAFSKSQLGLPVFGSLVLVAIGLGFVISIVVCRRRAPLLLTLGLFAAMPLYSAFSHWQNSEQTGHWFGYWFGHDMFKPPFEDKASKPLYPPMTKDAILFGGTDPGRFCPTYMIFCESFIPHRCQPAEDREFDRRDVYIITQNALADDTYLDYLRARYNRSRQIDPPFFSEFFRAILGDKESRTNILARAVAPLDDFFTALGARIEKRRRTYTSWFDGAAFTDLPALAAALRPDPQQSSFLKLLFGKLSPLTQQLLSKQGEEGALRRHLAEDLNRLLPGNLYDSERFKDVALSDYLKEFIAQEPQGDTRVRLNRLLLEAAYPKAIAPSIGGLYPDGRYSSLRRKIASIVITNIAWTLPPDISTTANFQMNPGNSNRARMWRLWGTSPSHRRNSHFWCQRADRQAHLRPQSQERLLCRGKLSAGLDVSAPHSFRDYHEGQPPACPCF